MRLLLGYLSPHRWMLLAGWLGGILAGVTALAQPMVTKMIIETLGQRGSLAGPVALLAVLTVAGALLSAVSTYLLGRAAEGVVLSARHGLVSHLLQLRVGAMDRLKPGDLLSRVTSDTTLLRTVTTYGLVHSVNGVFLVAAALVLMAVLDPVLLLLSLAVLVLNAVAVSAVVPRIRRATKRSQSAVGVMGSLLERALGAFRTVKASGAEERELAAVKKAAHGAWRRGVQVAGWTALMEASAGLAVQVSFLAVLGVGGIRVATGGLPVSSLIAFLLYLFLLTDPITSLITGVGQLQAGLAAVIRLREVHQLPTEPVVGGKSLSPRSGPASIAFRKVWFRYHHAEVGPWIHRDLSFELPPGGLTAIVGPSGAGKSTLFALLERYYEPETGSIAVDGRDTREWPLPDLRAAIGYVEQDAPVLAGTLRENLCLAAQGADDEDLESVVALTHLNELLERLPQGVDTLVGHRGTTLSGGERQRIAIARALLRRPRILLLDEATSQLDAVNESALVDLLATVALTTTILVVAHRLSTVITADRILVLDDGRVRAVGTHQELVAADDLYRELATTQLLYSTSDANHD
ncbi:MAG TPA: ABC transporter ATP-binding protein [Micromonosporaceae bacterium]|nr:ABC transporter ATP-binding protein [Micromonosporaceae bacterium]